MTRICSFTPLIPYFEIARPISFDEQFPKAQRLNVEIGFGIGEFLIQSALDRVSENFIGIEANWERTFKTLRSIDSQRKYSNSALPNVRILHVDAVIAFERFFNEKTIATIYSLFPCPWPKKGHIKHRLFSQKILKLFNSRLQDKGQIKIVTDFKPYADWVLEQVPETGFSFKINTIDPRYNTKFERKWMKAGQNKFFEIDLIKENHVSIPIKEDIELKSYRLKEFAPENFAFDRVVGEISVIVKDHIYDPKRQVLMIETVVAEENLTQHFRMLIRKERDFWRLCKAEGQHFFPTPGIVFALETIYKAASKNLVQSTQK